MIGEAIEVVGNDEDLDGLIESVQERFGIDPTTQPVYRGETVRYEDETDALHAAFAQGLRAYVRGFVDGKVDGTLEILEDREGDRE